MKVHAKQENHMESKLLWLVVFTTSLTAMAAMGVYFPLHVCLPLCILFPLAVLYKNWHVERFVKVKLLTLIFGRLLVLLAFLTIMPGYLLEFAIIWFLRINIAEATFHDLIRKKWFGFISGAILLASTWLLTIEWTGLFYLVDGPALLIWIFAYTIWNWNFVLGTFKRSLSMYHIGVLLSPLLYILLAFNPYIWLIMAGDFAYFGWYVPGRFSKGN